MLRSDASSRSFSSISHSNWVSIWAIVAAGRSGRGVPDGPHDLGAMAGALVTVLLLPQAQPEEQATFGLKPELFVHKARRLAHRRDFETKAADGPPGTTGGGEIGALVDRLQRLEVVVAGPVRGDFRGGPRDRCGVQSEIAKLDAAEVPEPHVDQSSRGVAVVGRGSCRRRGPGA